MKDKTKRKQSKKNHLKSDVNETNSKKKEVKKSSRFKNKSSSDDYINLSKKQVYSIMGILGATIVIVAIAFFINNIYPNCKSGLCNVPFLGKAVSSMNKGDIVAEFNGEKISSNDFNKEVDLILFLQGLPKEYISLISKKQLLNQTIIQDLIFQEASDKGYYSDKEEAKKIFENLLIKSGMQLSDFKNKLENESFNYDFFIEFNAKQNVIRKFINDTIFNKIKLEKESALNYYNANKEKFKTKNQIRASHILVNTSKEANEIIQSLNSGVDFAKLAKEKSIGPSAFKGGDLGYFSKGTMVPEFEDAAFSLEKIGIYTLNPVKTKFGYHIIELTGKKEERQLTFEEVKDKIEKELLQQQQNEELKAYINQLMANADIKIYFKEDKSKASPAPTSALAPSIPKSKKPNVELFVMSYCPYGVQLEKGILPVAKILNNKINFEVKFVNYAMHGKHEIDENTRQYCIQKEQNELFFAYLGCFLEEGNSDRCLTKTKVDTKKLSVCVASADKEFKITYNFENKQGQFPAYLIHNIENKKYGVRGSPTLIINGKSVSSGRDAQNLMNVICTAFTTKPKECDTDMSQYGSPAPGFGFDKQGSATTAGCGA